LEKRRKNLAICIIGSPASENLRGPQKFVVQFSKWLSHRSIKGMVICGSLKTLVKSIDIDDVSMMTSEDEKPVTTRYLPSIVFSVLFSFLSFLKIIHLNKKYRFSIIHAQDTNYGAVAAIAASKLIHASVVLHVHGINMSVVRLLIRPKWLEKSVIARLYRAYYFLLQRESIKRSDCVICVSENNKKYLPIGKKSVIPMGVNTASFQAAQNFTDVHEELRIPEHAFTMGYVGALSEGKGLHMLLKSFHYVFKEMPQEALKYLLIIGDGPEKKSLKELAGELGIGQYLRLTGFRTDVARLLSIMDVFVFMSESEGSPIAFLEAMAAGKAIIASNISSIREIVKHDEEAILVNRHNVEELNRAILLLYNNSGLRVRLGERARERARHYDVQRAHGKILKVYEELIHHRTK
jgi:glycosyltransferase involved in cell wall biosynthesis